MNEDDLNQLEARLRSWQPRRPSPALKWKLVLLSGQWVHRTARISGMLIPAAACALLLVLNLGSHGTFPGQAGRASLVALNSSNQNAEIYWSGPEGHENCPPAQIFKWTNASSSPSSMRSRQSGMN